jgi:hypothetical protein
MGTMRNKTLIPGVLALLLALGFAGTAAASKGAKAAKKKAGEEGAWTVKVTPDAASAAKGEKEFDDTLELHKGKFRSSACEPFGFGETTYRVEESNWMADGTSLKEGRNHWHGDVDGDTVNGQMTWTKPDGSVLNYTFTGTRTAPQPQTKGSKKPGK